MPHEAISVFDIFKIGIGPSSSHTLGPWRAAAQFHLHLKEHNRLFSVKKLNVLLYGSLAKTGKGHGTDIAVQLGLFGADPVTIEIAQIPIILEKINLSKKLILAGIHEIDFDPAKDIQFLFSESLPYHPNALTFLAEFQDGDSIAATYYSVGGGFVEQETTVKKNPAIVQLPFPIDTAEQLLHWCMKTGLPISEIVLENENTWRPESETREGIERIWETMRNCMYRGVHQSGTLPGGLNVLRRAATLNNKLLNGEPHSDYKSWVDAIRKGGSDFTYVMDWVSCFALAVNEENAAFGRVVTAPTNGAAGVIPAVLQYMICFLGGGDDQERITRFLLTAAEIGSIFKKGSTISAAMGGCQAEIGVSSAMAAAGLTEVSGGTQRQVLMAAEIAMEHHLGLTCDPIGGLVQIPCIERNSMGAIKAIMASQLALQGKPDFAKVSLDDVIRTMWETAQDMSQKYKETSDGGLASQIPISLSEC